MRCTTCGGESQVFDSRDSAPSVRRRRKCMSCGRRWTTYESEGSLQPAKLRAAMATLERLQEEFARELTTIATRKARQGQDCPSTALAKVREGAGFKAPQ